MIEFSEYLFQLRRNRQLLRKQVAYAASIDPSYLAALERGRRDPPNPKILARILDALNASEHERCTLKNAAAFAKLLGAIRVLGSDLPGTETLIRLARTIPGLKAQELIALETLVAGLNRTGSSLEEHIM